MAYDTYFLRKLVRTLLGALVVATMILPLGKISLTGKKGEPWPSGTGNWLSLARVRWWCYG